MTTRAAPWLRRTAVPPARRWAAVATPAPRRAGPAARPAARAFAATAQRSPWFAHFYRGPERPEANGAAAVPAATVSDAFPADVADAVEFDVSELAVLSRALGERLRRGRADDVGETDDVGKAHVFDSLALEAVAKMKSFAPAALASLSVTLVGLATQRALDGTGQRPAEAALYGRQLDLIANESAKKIRRFNANELARLTRSFARLPRSRSHDALFAAVADVAPRRLGQLSPPQTAYLLWASDG
ncbi:hypothetical protein M885DRAFT_333798 [Pelagophyceae sp. CCMP2097]|nr:hypothetical protein M885DRAFT_333798 [Pelagophyceae sp. CCMP2097]